MTKNKSLVIVKETIHPKQLIKQIATVIRANTITYYNKDSYFGPEFMGYPAMFCEISLIDLPA